MACAWTTFICYGSMMVISYAWGQKAYRIPYATKKLLAYMVIMLLLFFLHKGIVSLLDNIYLDLGSAFLLLSAYCWFIALIERKELAKFPVIGKYFDKP
jgi:hypothetical protein